LSGPVEQIQQAAERAAALTRQLSVLSRGRLSQQRRFDVDRAVRAAEPVIRRPAGGVARIEVATGARGAVVMADPFQFERALISQARAMVGAEVAACGTGREA
jgi:C4-dicarboxylate-specific signal transduction histidine kinase